MFICSCFFQEKLIPLLGYFSIGTIIVIFDKKSKHEKITLLVLLVSMSIFSQKYESHSYKTMLSEDNFEIREYDPVMKARAYSNTGNNNFMKLFRYISGNNEKNQKIPMTTPVYMKEDINGSMMEFVLPSTLNENNTSQPLSKDIELYMDQGGVYASITYSGYSNNKKRNKYTTQLNKKLEKMNIDKIGDFVHVSYDSPYKFYNRRNEVIIKVKY